MAYNVHRSVRSVCAVGLSALSLSAVQGIAGRFFKGGAVISLVPYIAGWAAAVLVLKAVTRWIPSERSGEEGEPQLRKGAGVRGRILGIVLCLVCLLGMNVGLYFVSGGAPARSGRELFTAALIGVLVKPLLEELLFRYGFLKTMAGGSEINLPAAITFQAVLFALWHDPGSVIFALFAGVCLGIVSAVSFDGTEKGYRRGFVNALAVHVLHNLILYVVEGLHP